MSERAWFEGVDIDDVDACADRIRSGRAASPSAWESLAIEAGIVATPQAYHARLRASALRAFERELEQLAGAADRTLIHLLRTYEATNRAILEVEQRVAEAVTETVTEEVTAGDLQTLAGALEADDAVLEDALGGIVEGLRLLDGEADHLRATIERQAQAVAPNLSTLAGPMLAARLVTAAGSLESLAKMSSSTVQVLGAEGALFAHLRGEASSPKHGLIFTHPAIRTAPPGDRGTIARALAGKLAIAARVDHYRGELEPSLEVELADRLSSIAGDGP